MTWDQACGSDRSTRIALVGMMGSGKTSVGRALADALGWGFIDTDAEIVLSAKRTIPEIFDTDGESAFRDLEASTIRAAASFDHVVIATGGGSVLREENRSVLLCACWVVWLAATPEEHAGRVRLSESRPVLNRYADPVEGARQILAERTPYYSQAHHTVDTTGRTIDEVVCAILTAFQA